MVDKQTGLQWTHCALGQTPTTPSGCSGKATAMTWAEALEAAANHKVTIGSGFTTTYDDRRLPNMKELFSIVEVCNFDPAINKNYFPDKPAG